MQPYQTIFFFKSHTYPLFLPLFWGKLDTGVTKDLRAGTATESRQAIDFELGVPNARLCLAPPLLGVAEVGRAKLLPNKIINE